MKSGKFIGFTGGAVVKNLPANAGDARDGGLISGSWVWKAFWSRKWQPTSIFLPGKFHGQKSLVGATVHGVVGSQTQLSSCTGWLAVGSSSLTRD